MTIDEAITQAREKAKEIRENLINGNNLEPYESYCNTMVAKSAEEYEQLAEWLEELVMLRLDSCMIHMPDRLQLVENGYNKALNDFVNACEKQFTTMYGQRYVDMRDIVNIAEQLKEGGENEL